MAKAGQLLVLLSCCGLAAAAAPPRTITFDGIAPVKVGMSIKQAEKALGVKLVREAPDDPDYATCNYVHPVDNRDLGISYMVEKGRISRIDVDSNTGHSPSTVRTANGIGLGSNERAIRAAYGARASVKPRPYNGEPDYEIMVWAPNRKTALLFEIGNGTVDQMRIGVYPSVQYWEGCEQSPFGSVLTRRPTSPALNPSVRLQRCARGGRK